MSKSPRERFGSRLGFLLVAAGCAVGIGNVWKFPYLCGQYGGAAFILIYLFCLLLLGVPILICELTVGRGSQRGCASAFKALEPEGTRWHLSSLFCMFGNYLLMMYYTVVCGWMFFYFIKYLKGDFAGAVRTSASIGQDFQEMIASPGLLFTATVVIVTISFGVCFLGVKKGVEKVCKFMMIGLFSLIVLLAAHSLLLPGANEGIRFYLVPDFDRLMKQGLGKVVFAAMSQAFFTLSIGIGAMSLFGSYLEKERSLTGEALTITVLDTMVALLSGFIIIPACFAYGINPDAGPSLIFITMPNVFQQMPGGSIWGTLFFLFLVFAALSTVVAVFENILSFAMELFGWNRKKTIIFNALVLLSLTLPCILGFNLWSGFEPLGPGTNVMDLEDFIVSNNMLPLGALLYLLLCVCKNGWGYEAFIKEVDSGHGLKFPSKIKWYMAWILPLLVFLIYIQGYYDFFCNKGSGYLYGWMVVATALLLIVLYITTGRRSAAKKQ